MSKVRAASAAAMAVVSGAFSILILPQLLTPESDDLFWIAVLSNLFCLFTLALAMQGLSGKKGEGSTKSGIQLHTPGIWIRGLLGTCLGLVSFVVVLFLAATSVSGDTTDIIRFCHYFIPSVLLCWQGVRMTKPIMQGKVMKGLSGLVVSLTVVYTFLVIHDDWQWRGMAAPLFDHTRGQCIGPIYVSMGKKLYALSYERGKDSAFVRAPDIKVKVSKETCQNRYTEITTLEGRVNFDHESKTDFGFTMKVSPEYGPSKRDGEPYLRVKDYLKKKSVDLKKLPVENGFHVYYDDSLYISTANVSPNGYPAVFGCSIIPWRSCSTAIWKDGVRFDLPEFDSGRPRAEWLEIYKKLNKMIKKIENADENRSGLAPVRGLKTGKKPDGSAR